MSRRWLTAGVLVAAGLLTLPADAAEPESRALVDWPEPDRSPPPKMLSRLSVGMLVNDEAGVTGHVRLDCRRPEIGHVTGEVSFTCF